MNSVHLIFNFDMMVSVQNTVPVSLTFNNNYAVMSNYRFRASQTEHDNDYTNDKVKYMNELALYQASVVVNPRPDDNTSLTPYTKFVVSYASQSRMLHNQAPSSDALKARFDICSPYPDELTSYKAGYKAGDICPCVGLRFVKLN